MATDFDLAGLRDAVAHAKVQWQLHALERLQERGISRDEVFTAILKGEAIETYLTDRPLPSCLVFHKRQEPLHVVASLDAATGTAYVITAYRPDQEHFESDYKTRREKS
ncbi:MAG: DUF4258 domain-containing protein [Candidatus Schekmanbacteria bacterium]|nr:DUF4258 domain-containing protein [Candidatus Schekmanbacteria bacterium]